MLQIQRLVSALKVANLSQENKRLAKDIEKMEVVLERHRLMLETEAKSLNSQIRKEVGGSRWQAGAKGQMSGYKSIKGLHKDETTVSKPQRETKKGDKKLKNHENREVRPSSHSTRTLTDTKDISQQSHPAAKKYNSSSGDISSKVNVTMAAPKKTSSDRQAGTLSAHGRAITATSARPQPRQNSSGFREVGGASATDRTVSKSHMPGEEQDSVMQYSERIAIMKGKVLSKASAKVKLLEKQKRANSRLPFSKEDAMPGASTGRDMQEDNVAMDKFVVTEDDAAPSTNEPGCENIVKPEVVTKEILNNVSANNEMISVTLPAVGDLIEDDERVSSSTDRSEEEEETKDVPTVTNSNSGISNTQSAYIESHEHVPMAIGRQSPEENEKAAVSEQKLNNYGIAQTEEPPPKKDPVLYDPALSVWLYGLKLLDTDKYIQIFVDNEVTMEGVKLLTDKHLKEMGITAMGPLSKLSHGIKVLRGEVEEDSLPSSRGRADGGADSPKDIDSALKPGTCRSEVTDASSSRRDDTAVKKSSQPSELPRRAKVDNSSEIKLSGRSAAVKKGETGKDTRRVKSATTGRSNKEESKNVKSTRPVSANVAQRSLASGVQAASHRLKKKKELQEKETKRQEKLTKMKKAERDKMAAQFHMKKKVTESSRRKSSSSDVDEGSGHSSDGVVEDLLMVYTKGIQGTKPKANTSTKPESPSKTKTSVYPQRAPKSDRSSAVPLSEGSAALLVQGDQLIEPTTRESSRTGRRTESHHSSRSTESSPLSSQEDRLKELEIQVLGLQQKGPDSSQVTIEMIDKLQRQLQSIQGELAGKMAQSDLQDDQTGGESKNAVEVEAPKAEKSKTKGSSSSVTKRELMRKVRKQNEEHRKQIRHLEAELTRLKHKDPMRSCEIPEDDIRFSEADLTGEGAFSQVFRGSYHGSEVAIKRLKTPLSVQDKNYFAEEVNLMRELRHPRVVLLLGVCTTSHLPLMVLEYMSNGSLYSWLHDPNRPPLDHISYFQLARDTSLGMNYLHRHKPAVLHMDLKSMNVLIGSHGRAKIGDFGFSKLRHDADLAASQSGVSMRGTPAWMAPELLDPTIGDVTTKVDVYSFGMILWEMFTRRHPYKGLSVFQIIERVRQNKRPEIPDTCPAALSKLINLCWEQKPNRRPSFKDILISLEGLSFPPEWRDLFAAAGIPREAMDDAHSARSIIDLVNKSVEMSESELAAGVGIVPPLELGLSRDNIKSGELMAKGSEAADIDVDSVSSDDDWVAKTPVKESIDDFVLKIPQNVLDAMNESRDDDDLHAQTEDVDGHVNIQQNISEKSDSKDGSHTSSRSNRSSRSSGRSDKSEQGMGLSPVHGKSPGRSVKFADQKADSSSAEKSQRSSTAWEEGQVKVKGGSIPPPPPVPDLSQSLAITQGARRKTASSIKTTQPMRRTVATVVTPAAGHVTIPVSELLKQKAKLRPATDPHPSQLADLTRISQDKFTSIAEILKKAVGERRTAMREDAASIEHSYPSGAWSLEEGM
ncbi:uncharacterized protein [Ptychodera flava]|uniref:uncharacterized protein isoform X1 n=2 Tax=Ptychodera flava TaxID=63121 RepID=UPI00396A72AB